MKRTLLIAMPALILMAALVMPIRAAQPPRYTVYDLGTLPGGALSPGSQGNTDTGLVAGVAAIARGEMAGVAEESVTDASCIAPVQHHFQAVTWGQNKEIHKLQPPTGDTVGFAFWMNDIGQVVGTSGSCADTLPVGVVVGPHAVLWE